jgi:hypothetical protein
MDQATDMDGRRYRTNHADSNLIDGGGKCNASVGRPRLAVAHAAPALVELIDA